MTTIRLSNPFLVADLCEQLRSHSDCVAEIKGRDTIEVTLLGSYNQDALRMEAELRVRAWEAAQRARGVDVHVEFL
jgi:hypothetical protein